VRIRVQDYLKLVRPHLLSDTITLPMYSPAAAIPAASQPQLAAVKRQNSNGASLRQQGLTDRLKCDTEPCEQFSSRIGALREAGHPFLRIVDRMIEARTMPAQYLFCMLTASRPAHPALDCNQCGYSGARLPGATADVRSLPAHKSRHWQKQGVARYIMRSHIGTCTDTELSSAESSSHHGAHTSGTLFSGAHGNISVAAHGNVSAPAAASRTKRRRGQKQWLLAHLRASLQCCMRAASQRSWPF
jgi:hypothetical protein